MKQIIIIQKGELKEVWGTLTECCNNHPNFNYGYLKHLKFPFEYKGYSFTKIYYRTKYF